MDILHIDKQKNNLNYIQTYYKNQKNKTKIKTENKSKTKKLFSKKKQTKKLNTKERFF
jgi:hypothetical protein